MQDLGVATAGDAFTNIFRDVDVTFCATATVLFAFLVFQALLG
ncbi:hypothetical protein [Streptomyces avermitilis]